MEKPTKEVDEYGSIFYKLNGKYHREDGPACEWADGNKYWYLNGKRHREDGPAIEWVDGEKEWYLNGELHREDGPAMELASGSKYWYLNGRQLTEQEFLATIQKKQQQQQELEPFREVDTLLIRLDYLEL
jgi:hypothetical protein